MTLLEVALLFVRLGAFSFGGASSVVAEMQRELVDDRAVMTRSEFGMAYGLGQATPGPAVLYIIPVAFKAAGALGAIVAMLAFLVPPVILQLLVAKQWERLSAVPLVQAIHRTLVPISVGLVAASLYTLGAPLTHDPVSIAGVLLAAVAAKGFGASPAIIVLGLGLAGALLGSR